MNDFKNKKTKFLKLSDTSTASSVFGSGSF